MGFFGNLFSRKDTSVTDFSKCLPLKEIKIPELPDASEFAMGEAIEGFGSPDDNKYWKGGGLNHVYRSRLGFKKEQCPLCSNETKQKYIVLIYATDTGVRQSLSPSAWICEPCSCLVLDEMLPALSARWRGYSYLVPVGMANANSRFEENDIDLNKFATYEGKKPIFVLDNNTKEAIDIKYKGEINSSTSFKQFAFDAFQQKLLSDEKMGQNRKAEKQARKKQRN